MSLSLSSYMVYNFVIFSQYIEFRLTLKLFPSKSYNASYKASHTIKLKLIVLIDFLLCLTSWLFCLRSWGLIRVQQKLYWRVILMLLLGFRNTRGAVKRSLGQIMRWVHLWIALSMESNEVSEAFLFSSKKTCLFPLVSLLFHFFSGWFDNYFHKT